MEALKSLNPNGLMELLGGFETPVLRHLQLPQSSDPYVQEG
jgi:hypothetical protein